MATIHLSCGHSVESLDEAFDVLVQCSDAEGNRALSYEMVCADCLALYEEDGLSFAHEADAYKWLIKES